MKLKIILILAMVMCLLTNVLASSACSITFAQEISPLVRVKIMDIQGNTIFNGLVSNVMDLEIIQGTYSFLFTFPDNTKKIVTIPITEDTQVTIGDENSAEVVQMNMVDPVTLLLWGRVIGSVSFILSQLWAIYNK